MRNNVLLKLQSIFIIAVLAMLAWSTPSVAAVSCAIAYKDQSTDSRTTKESPELQEAQEAQVSEIVADFIEKFNQDLTAPGGVTEVSNQIFTFTSKWLKNSGEVIRQQSENLSKVKGNQIAEKLISETILQDKSLIKLAELVARNKSLKIRLLNWIPKYTHRKVEQISEQIRYRSGDMETLVKQLNDENISLGALAKGLTSEGQKINTAYEVILRLRDHYQQMLWTAEKSDNQNSDYVMNAKQVLVHLEKELNNLLTLQTVSKTLGETLRSQISLNNNAQIKAREAIVSSPSMITSVSDRALDLEPKNRYANAQEVEEAKQVQKKIRFRKIVGSALVATSVLAGSMMDSSAPKENLAPINPIVKTVEVSKPAAEPESKLISTPKTEQSYKVTLSEDQHNLSDSDRQILKEIKLNGSVSQIIGMMKLYMPMAKSVPELLQIISYGVSSPTELYKNEVSTLFLNNIDLFINLQPTEIEINTAKKKFALNSISNAIAFMQALSPHAKTASEMATIMSYGLNNPSDNYRQEVRKVWLTKNYKRFYMLNPTAEEINRVKKDLYFSQDITPFMNALLPEAKTAADMIGIMSYAVDNPDDYYKQGVSKIWLANIERFKRLNPTIEEINKVKKDLYLVQDVTTFMNSFLPQVKTADEMIEIMSYTVDNPGDYYKQEVNKMWLANIGRFKMLNPTIEEINKAKVQSKAVYVSTALITAFLPEVKTASKMIEIMSFVINNPSDFYKQEIKNIWKNNLDFFYSLNPTEAEKELFRKAYVEQ